MSVLTSQQLQVIQDLLDQIDPNSGGPPAPTQLQPGGTEPGGPPARDGYNPTAGDPSGPSSGFDRRRQARDNPPQFNGAPTTDGKGPRPYGQSHQPNYGG